MLYKQWLSRSVAFVSHVLCPLKQKLLQVSSDSSVLLRQAYGRERVIFAVVNLRWTGIVISLNASSSALTVQ